MCCSVASCQLGKGAQREHIWQTAPSSLLSSFIFNFFWCYEPTFSLFKGDRQEHLKKGTANIKMQNRNKRTDGCMHLVFNRNEYFMPSGVISCTQIGLNTAALSQVRPGSEDSGAAGFEPERSQPGQSPRGPGGRGGGGGCQRRAR